VKTLLATAAVLLALAPAAWAATRPPVGKAQQQHLKYLLSQLGAEDLAYVPAYMPATYSVTEEQASFDQLTLSFTSSKYIPESTKADQYGIAFGVQPFKGKLAGCAKGASGTKRSGGKTVYFKFGSVWRCLKAPTGRLVVVFADSPRVARAEMVHVIASVARMN
jgi:hypothetical protein